MNSVILTGRLTRDVELNYLPNGGTAVGKFSLAVDKNLSKEKKREMEAQGKYTVDFINIVVFGKQAENCANFISKGSLVAVNGRLQTGSYTNKEGQKVYTVDVNAQNVEFLEFGKQEDEQGDKQGFNEVPEDEDIPF